MAGWRETRHYRDETLLDNWNEERFDKKWLTRPQPLPSAASYAYTSTYADAFNKGKFNCQQFHLPNDRVPRAYPYHQRELDPPGVQAQVDLFQSEHRTEFVDPRLRKQPLDTTKKDH